MEEIQERMRQNFQEASEHLRTLLYFSDPVELFVGTVASMIFVPPEDMIDSKIGTMPVEIEHLAFSLRTLSSFSADKFLGHYRSRSCYA